MWNLVGSIVSCVLMVFFMNNVILIYVIASLLGLFMSTYYPLAISYPTILNMKMTGLHTSLCATFSSLGEFVVPYLMGLTIAFFGTKHFIYFCILLSVI